MTSDDANDVPSETHFHQQGNAQDRANGKHKHSRELEQVKQLELDSEPNKGTLTPLWFFISVLAIGLASPFRGTQHPNFQAFILSEDAGLSLLSPALWGMTLGAGFAPFLLALIIYGLFNVVKRAVMKGTKWRWSTVWVLGLIIAPLSIYASYAKGDANPSEEDSETNQPQELFRHGEQNPDSGSISTGNTASSGNRPSAQNDTTFGSPTDRNVLSECETGGLVVNEIPSPKRWTNIKFEPDIPQVYRSWLSKSDYDLNSDHYAVLNTASDYSHVDFAVKENLCGNMGCNIAVTRCDRRGCKERLWTKIHENESVQFTDTGDWLRVGDRRTFMLKGHTYRPICLVQ